MKPRRHTKPFAVTLARGFTLARHLETETRIAYRSRISRGGTVFVGHPFGGSGRRVFICRHTTLNCPLAWSPDGRTLYLSHDQIHAVDVATRRSHPVTRFGDDEQFSAIWFLKCSPDGRVLLFMQSKWSESALAHPSGQRTQLSAIGTDGEDLRVVFEGSSDTHLWSVDCNWAHHRVALATSEPGGLYGLWMMDLDGGRRVKLASFPHQIHNVAISPDGERLLFLDHRGLHALGFSDRGTRDLCPFGGASSWSPNGESMHSWTGGIVCG